MAEKKRKKGDGTQTLVLQDAFERAGGEEIVEERPDGTRVTTYRLHAPRPAAPDFGSIPGMSEEAARAFQADVDRQGFASEGLRIDEDLRRLMQSEQGRRRGLLEQPLLAPLVAQDTVSPTAPPPVAPVPDAPLSDFPGGTFQTIAPSPMVPARPAADPTQLLIEQLVRTGVATGAIRPRRR